MHRLPKLAASPKLVALTLLAAVGGFLFGYDTGIISSANLYLRDEFGLSSFQQEVIVSATVGAAAIFSPIGGIFNNALGRKRTILISSIIFITGSVILFGAISFFMLLLGRLIVGIAIGMSSATIPLYLAEASPPQYRGRSVVGFQLMITFGMWIASVVGASLSYLKSSLSWRLMLGLAAVPAGVQFIGFYFMPESPRWLVSEGREVEAFESLTEINRQSKKNDSERSAKCTAAAELTSIMRHNENTKRAPKLHRLNRSFWKALLLGCTLQTFQQLSGINTVMYYSATIIQMAGIRDNTSAIWISSMTSFINFVSTFSSIYVVDRFGRRPLLLTSIVGVIITLLGLSASFWLISQTSLKSTSNSSAMLNAENGQCSKYLE